MVDNEGEVAVLLAPTDLIDPDVEQSLEPAGSSSSAHTRAMIRPTVSQSIRTSRFTVPLSVRVANHATRHSKSRVNSDPGLANGTPSARAPCSGHHRRRRRQWISSRHVPRSRCHQTVSSGLVSFRALVECSHSGQMSRRRRNATSTTTRSGSN